MVSPEEAAARPAAIEPAGTFHRDGSTWLIYLIWAALGFAVNGLGSVLLPLKEQLGLTTVQTSLYSAFFAIGLVLTGLVGHRLVERVGRRRLLMIVLALVGAGALVMTLGTVVTTFVGAAGIGFGAALMIQVLPVELVGLQPAHAPRALSEANSLSSIAGIIAPFGVAWALSAGLGWAFGYSIPLAVAAGLSMIGLFVARQRAAAQDNPTVPDAPTAAAPVESPWRPWIEMVGSVAVEFCFVLWSATAVASWHRVDTSLATLIAGCFLVGMGVGRFVGAPLAGRFGVRNTTIGCLLLALVGSLAFWFAGNHWIAAGALLIGGLGVSLLYPLTLSRLLAADPLDTDRATSRSALASGVAILSVPPLLAGLADLIGLHLAFLVAPGILVALIGRNLWPRAKR
ncbi:MFS transporter [Propionicimonas paludicola]|nr:MFS transporter [Propionicimonas paludicola]